MRRMWAVCKREFAGYFTTPVGYVVVGAFAAISGLGFCSTFLFYCKMTTNPSQYSYASVPDFEETFLSPFIVFCGILVMFLGPLITMRLLAEERNRGTMELLLTHPLRDRDILFGKFMAALGMLLVMMLMVCVHLGLTAHYVDVEPAVLIFGLVTVFLMGMAFLSMGLFVSAMSANQITAGTMTFALSLVSYILGSLGEHLPKKNPAPEAWLAGIRQAIGLAYGLFRNFVTELPLDVHAKQMAQGIFAPKDVVYYLLVTSFFLFLTFRALESRKWRA